LVGFLSYREAVDRLWIINKLNTHNLTTNLLGEEGNVGIMGMNFKSKIQPIIQIASIVLSLIYPNNNVASVSYLEKYWIPFVLPINMIGIPLLLWGIGVIRKNSKTN